jgi:LysM repeat protein
MNNPSPLMPQGSLLEQKNKGRTKVKIAVFFVLAVHAIGLLALLMQGCNREPKAAQNEATNNASAPTFDATNPPPMVDTSAIPTAIATNPPPAADTTPAPPAAATDYTIVAGDSFSKIASKFHVTVSALMAANPGLEPTKLQVGKKIKIPPPAPVTNTTSQTAPPANGEVVYSVKSGDTLSKIATDFHTTVNKIRAANNLKTDSIRVGQKLTIPKAGAATTPDAAPVPTNGTTPAPK